MHHSLNFKPYIHLINCIEVLSLFWSHHILISIWIFMIAFIKSINKVSFSDNDNLWKDQHIGFFIIRGVAIDFVFYFFLRFREWKIPTSCNMMVSHLIQLVFHQYISKLICCLYGSNRLFKTWWHHLDGKLWGEDFEWVVRSCSKCKRKGGGNCKRPMSERTDSFIRIQDGATQLEIHF